jgi:protein involved in polysaccharide export with SLBB domain
MKNLLAGKLTILFTISLLFVSKFLFAQVPPLPIIDPTFIVEPSTQQDVKEKIEKKAEVETSEEKKMAEAEEEKKKIKEKEDEEKDILALKRQSTLPPAKIWGQNFFRDQSISLFVRSRDIRALPSYLLDVGDELNISVWGVVDYSKSAKVTADGYIDLTLPALMIPRLYVKGMKFGDAQQLIKERLANHINMRGSFSDVKLNYSRNIVVNITGEVFNPGSYTIPAVNTAFNALVASNGPNQIGSVRKIKVVSAQQQTKILDTYKFVTNPNLADEFFLSNNDFIYVPIAERVVEITGSVKRPYFYELIEGEDLKSLILYAGGLAADAYYRNIQIKRYANNEEKIIDIDFGDLLNNNSDFKLLNGDIVTISPIKEAYSNFVTIKGAVKLPGEYELKENIKIKDVLMKAGIMLSAVKERIYVKRVQPDFSIKYLNLNVDSILYHPESEANIFLTALDDIEVKFKSDYVDEYNILLNGAVRKPGKYRHSDSLSLADLIYLGNGIKNEAKNSYVEISRLIPKKDGTTETEIFQFPINNNLNIREADNFLLKPYDQVFVRLSKGFELPKNIIINGEIMYPGIYTLEKRDEKVSDILLRAGGLTKVAFLEGAQLFRKGDGYVILNLSDLEKNNNSRFNYLLKDGDSINIPVIKDLVSIAGRINHPEVKENSEIAEMELKIKLLKLNSNEKEREIMLTQYKIDEMKDPKKINSPFHKFKTANFYINKYGGGIDRQNGGRKRLVFVRYADGSVKKTRNYILFKSYPKVEKGAMVYIDTKTKKEKIKDPNRKPVDWNETIARALGFVTTGLTSFALIRALTQ